MNALKPLMINGICSVEEFKQIEKDGYTLFNNEMVLALIINREIGKAAFLWFFIRSMMSGRHDYIQLTINQIANRLNESKSTIQKWKRVLVTEGFLEVIEQKVGKCENLANQYRATAPKSFYESKSKTKKTSVKKTSPTENHQTFQSVELKDNSQERGGCDTPPIQPEIVTVSEQTHQPNNEVFNQKTHPKLFETLSIQLKEQGLSTCFLSMLPFIEIEIRGEACYCFNVMNDYMIDALKQRTEILIKVIHQYSEKYIQRTTFLKNSALEVTGQQPAATTTQKPSTPEKSPLKSIIKTINSISHQRLTERVSEIEIAGQKIQSLHECEAIAREIEFAIQYGCLADKTPIHGMNIALKLLKENRWRTPAGFTPYPQGVAIK